MKPDPRSRSYLQAFKAVQLLIVPRVYMYDLSRLADLHLGEGKHGAVDRSRSFCATGTIFSSKNFLIRRSVSLEDFLVEFIFLSPVLTVFE